MKSNIQAIINGYFSEVNSKYKTVVLLGNQPFSQQITSPNTKYLIKYDFDLQNEEIEIPENCIIAIDGGSISNGTLIGNNTILLNVNQTDNILDEVCRLGTWAKMYYSKEAEEFNFLTIEVIKNLIMNLFPGGIKGFEIVFVEELPTPSEETLYKIYLVPSTNPKEQNITEEFITLVQKNEDVTTYKWEKIGSTNVSLINYYTKLEVNNLLNNKVDKVENKTLSSNDYTDFEKNKLLNIEPFAQKNIQSDWFQNDISKDDYIKNKPSNATSVSDGFMSKEDYIRLSEFNINNFYTKGEIDLIIDDLEFGIMKKVDALPAVGEEHIIYLVPKEAPATGFDEWIWVADENRFELIGDTNIDLSDYYKKSEVDALVNTEKTRAQDVEQNLQNEILGQTGAIQTAISNANAATAAANAAATAANNVNATLNTTTNVVTITDRTGTSKSIDLTNKTNAELKGSVVKITDKDGNESSIDLQDATDERVFINCSTTVEGTSVSGLSINVYYGDILHTTLTTNAQGSARIDIPNGTTYKIVFPRLVGCNPIPDVKHTAVMSQRSVEAVYVEEFIAYEHVKFNVKKADSINDVQPFEGVEVKVEYSEHVEHYISDAQGIIEFDMPIGTTYVYTVIRPDGYYMYEGRTVFVKEALSPLYEITIRLVPYETGVFVITNSGAHYNFEQFKQAVEEGIVVKEDAVLIKIATELLCSYDSAFAISIDEVVDIGLKPCSMTTETGQQIPLGTNSAYNGYANSLYIVSAIDFNSPAVSGCLNTTFTLPSVTLHGFLGADGQMGTLWGLRDFVDEIIEYVRPQSTQRISDLLDSKWTSTRISTISAYVWGRLRASYAYSQPGYVTVLKTLTFYTM